MLLLVCVVLAMPIAIKIKAKEEPPLPGADEALVSVVEALSLQANPLQADFSEDKPREQESSPLLCRQQDQKDLYLRPRSPLRH